LSPFSATIVQNSSNLRNECHLTTTGCILDGCVKNSARAARSLALWEPELDSRLSA
jgi:hypothetical protein